MIIIVTGSVGTGKTTIAVALSKRLRYSYANLNELIKKNKLQGRYIKKLDTYGVDVKKLNKFLVKLILSSKGNLLIDSHLSHYLPKKYVDYCIVCKCELKTLAERLKTRDYSKVKIRENLDSEIFDVCLIEALENKHKVIVVDTGENNVKQCVDLIFKKVR